MECPACDRNNVQIAKRSRKYLEKGCFLLVKNVPQIYCQDCEETYVTGITLHKTKNIREYFEPPKTITDEGIVVIDFETIIFENPDTGEEFFPSSQSGIEETVALVDLLDSPLMEIEEADWGNATRINFEDA